MSDAGFDSASPAPSAGALLRIARERSGMHIGLLAATLKVPVRKLELLESDRFDELHDATFVRALSLSVCRALRCDPGPVLAALPRQDSVVSTLEQVNVGMNAPFSQRAGSPAGLGLSVGRKAWWALALMVGLSVLWWVSGPEWSWRPKLEIGPDAATSPAVSVVPAPQGTASVARPAASASEASSALVQTVHGAPAEPNSSAPGPMASSVSVTEPSWIEAADLQGRPIWSRTLTPGEIVALESASGMRLTIGNAAGTQVRWRGQTLDLAPSTRDNVARLELK